MDTNELPAPIIQTPTGRAWPKVDLSDLTVLAVLLAIVAYLSFSTSSFLSTANLMAILVAVSLIAIVACGQTFVVITGGIDLSSGSVVALSGICAAMAMQNHVPVVLAVLIGILVGAACGLFNGIAVTWLGMNPFIVTLASLAMARGLAFILPNGATLFGFDESFDAIGGGLVHSFPIAGIISLVVLGVAAFVLGKTVFGSEVYAVGGNREAALMTGIPVQRTLLSVYVISGALAGLGGIILAGRLDSAQPIAATGLELNSIAAVVIGGASLFGGRGSMFGTILGVLLIGVINNGLTLHNVEPFWVQFIQGAVIFLAVLLDSLSNKRKASS
jgi:ribose transport system permease protein